MATKVGDLFAELNLKAKDALRDLDKFVTDLETATVEAGKAEDATEDLGDELDDMGGKARKSGDQISKAMRQARKEFRSLGQGAKRVGEVVGRGLSTIAKAAAAAGLGVGAFAAIWATSTEEIARDANKLGIPVDEFEELNAAIKLMGGESDTAREAFKTFQEGMGDLVNEGAGPLKDAFDRVGLTLDDVKGKPISEQLGIVFDAINQLPTAAQRTGANMLAFADDGFRMGQLVAQGSEGLKLAREEAVKLGAVISGPARDAAIAFTKTIREGSIVLNSLANVIGEAVVPVITKVLKGFQAWAEENKALLKVKINEFVEKFLTLAKELLPVLGKVIGIAGDVIEQFGGIEQAIKSITVAWFLMEAALATSNPIIIAATAAGLALTKLLQDIETAEQKTQQKTFRLARGVELTDEQRAALAGGTGRRGAENRAFAANAARATQAFREATGDVQRAEQAARTGPIQERTVRARAATAARARLAQVRAQSESANATLQAVLGDIAPTRVGAGETRQAADESDAAFKARQQALKAQGRRGRQFVREGEAERAEAERQKREGGKKKSLSELIAGATGQGLAGAVGSLAPKGPGTTINNFTVNNNVGATTVDIAVNGLEEGGPTEVVNALKEQIGDVLDARIREAFEAGTRQVTG